MKGRRVLVVEDEALIAMLIEDLFTDLGAEVLGPAATVHDALRLIEREVGTGIDAAVLDLDLQGEPALAVANRLASLDIPFVFVTGGDKDSMGQRHCNVAMLAKPFDCEGLISAIAAVMSTTDSVFGQTRRRVVASRQAVLPRVYHYIRRRRAGQWLGTQPTATHA